MGEKTDATPDGRFRGAPLSKNLAASIGQDKNGVTAYLNSLLKMDGAQCPDGYVADVVLHSSAVKGEEGMAAFEALLTTFMASGGGSVHFNVLSPEVLLKAQAEPEKYRNLQIRLCGWNVRFVNLSKQEQDEFILQAAQENGL
jgi:formate C-acetyltransferase